MADTTEKLHMVQREIEFLNGRYVDHNTYGSSMLQIVNDLLIICANQQRDIKELKAHRDTILKRLNLRLVPRKKEE